MEKYFKTLQALIIVALIIVILLMRSCSGNQTITEPKVITNTVTQYDTITKKVPNYVPKYVTKIEYIRDTILDKRPVDTLGAGDAFFSISSLFSAVSSEPEIILLTGNIAGSIKIQNLGHRKYITREEFVNISKSILNF